MCRDQNGGCVLWTATFWAWPRTFVFPPPRHRGYNYGDGRNLDLHICPRLRSFLCMAGRADCQPAETPSLGSDSACSRWCSHRGNLFLRTLFDPRQIVIGSSATRTLVFGGCLWCTVSRFAAGMAGVPCCGFGSGDIVWTFAEDWIFSISQSSCSAWHKVLRFYH